MDEHLQAEICARIKQAREEAGMTLEDLADALGVTQRAYWNYEHNRVPFRRLREIAEITATTQGWLLHGETPALAPDALGEVAAGVQQLERSQELVQQRLGEILDRLEAIAGALSAREERIPGQQR
jgi:transcriptional regulator with XRE-family HTH domain